MGPVLLSAVLTVAVAVPSHADSLVVRLADPARSQLWWKPRPLLLQAMRKYAEFFGTRSFSSRSVELQSGSARAAQRCRTRIGTPRAAKHVTKKAMKEHWCQAAKTLVESWRKKKQTSAPSQVIIDKKNCPRSRGDFTRPCLLRKHARRTSRGASLPRWRPRQAWLLQSHRCKECREKGLCRCQRVQPPRVSWQRSLLRLRPKALRQRSQTAALSQSLSPKWAQKVRQVLQKRAAALSQPLSPKSALGATSLSSAPVSLFRLAAAC